MANDSEDKLITVEVQHGDTLIGLLSQSGVEPTQWRELVGMGKATEPVRVLYPGDRLEVHIRDGQLMGLVYQPEPLRSWVIERQPSRFSGRWVMRTPERRVVARQFAIERSLYTAALKGGLGENVITQVADLFSWDIDFALDIRRGDRIAVVLEEFWIDGRKLRDGDVLAARMVNAGRTLDALRYQRADGSAEYFDRYGRSLRKQFLRAPVDFRRISSRFKPERWHPVLGLRRPHRGVDYAAALGTPVRVTGDGTVIHAAAQGGYGRTVIVRHGPGMETLYAHLRGYASGLSVGQAVRQGDVIGFVGRSGLATGPHLHYELRVWGEYRNPLTFNLPDARPLAIEERPLFDEYAARVFAEIENLLDDSRLAGAPASAG